MNPANFQSNPANFPSIKAAGHSRKQVAQSRQKVPEIADSEIPKSRNSRQTIELFNESPTGENPYELREYELRESSLGPNEPTHRMNRIE